MHYADSNCEYETWYCVHDPLLNRRLENTRTIVDLK